MVKGIVVKKRKGPGKERIRKYPEKAIKGKGIIKRKEMEANVVDGNGKEGMEGKERKENEGKRKEVNRK